MVFHRRALLAALPLAIGGALACGSRSGLPIGDSFVTDAGAESGIRLQCVHEHASGTLAPAYVEVVLDGSGSMGDDGKWIAATSALNALFDEYLASADHDTALGMLVFSDHKDPSGADGPYPTSVDVAPGFVDRTQYSALRARLTGTRPVGPTPTFAALSGAYSALRGYLPDGQVHPRGRRVAVLVSDGAPNAISGSGGIDTEKTKTIALADAARSTTPSILTYAIGIGPFPPPAYYDYDPEFMGRVAIAGGTRASNDCDPTSHDLVDICHLQITPSQDRSPSDLASDMLRALHDARARTTDPCSYVLEGEIARMDPTGTRVTVTSSAGSHDVPEDATNGWEYDAPASPHGLTLRGTACDEVTNDASATVKLTYSCKG